VEPLLGEIVLFPYDFAPRGWMICEGQLIPIQSNAALFTLLENHFGGDARVTFALPNLKGKEPLPNMSYYIAIEGRYPIRPGAP
jgi:microcystin-dependent protein